MKKLLATILIMCFVVSGCSNQPYLWSEWTVSQPQSQSTPTPQIPSNAISVGVSIRDETPYIEDLMRKLVREAKNIGANILLRDGENSFEKQLSQVEAFIASGVDVILLNPSSYFDCAPAIQSAVDANIPIITFIDPVSNQQLCETFVGWDYTNNGMLLAQQMASDINYSGKVAILEGNKGTVSQTEHSKGYSLVLEENTDIEVVAVQSANLDRWQAMSIVQNWIENGIEFDAILAQSDTMALGAVDALKESSMLEEVMVYGADGDYYALSSISINELTATVVQDANFHVQMLVECIENTHYNYGNPPDYDIPVTLVNADNITEFYFRIE